MARERVRRERESLGGGIATVPNGKPEKGQSSFVPTSFVASSV